MRLSWMDKICTTHSRQSYNCIGESINQKQDDVMFQDSHWSGSYMWMYICTGIILYTAEATQTTLLGGLGCRNTLC